MLRHPTHLQQLQTKINTYVFSSNVTPQTRETLKTEIIDALQTLHNQKAASALIEIMGKLHKSLLEQHQDYNTRDFTTRLQRDSFYMFCIISAAAFSYLAMELVNNKILPEQPHSQKVFLQSEFALIAFFWMQSRFFKPSKVDIFCYCFAAVINVVIYTILTRPGFFAADVKNPQNAIAVISQTATLGLFKLNFKSYSTVSYESAHRDVIERLSFIIDNIVNLSPDYSQWAQQNQINMVARPA